MIGPQDSSFRQTKISMKVDTMDVTTSVSVACISCQHQLQTSTSTELFRRYYPLHLLLTFFFLLSDTGNLYDMVICSVTFQQLKNICPEQFT